MSKAGRDLGVLLAGILLVLSVRVSRTPVPDPVPEAVAAPAALPASMDASTEPTPHVEVRVLRIVVVRDLGDAVAVEWPDPARFLPRLPDLGRCAS